MVNGASSDLNSMTTSYGMVALHEYNHTTSDGGQQHSDVMSGFGMIDQPDIIGNVIRSEMSTASGTNWGQRESYISMPVNGINYVPFSSQSLMDIRKAKAYEGTWQGILKYPPPTSSVITLLPGE